MRYRCFFIPEYLIYKFLTKLAVVNWNISNDHKFESILFSVNVHVHQTLFSFIVPDSISVCFIQNRAYDKRLDSHLLREKKFQ